MAIQDFVSYNAVYSAITPDLPDGDARKAWLNLEKIFKPVSNASKHEKEQKFNQCALTKEDKNTDEFFSDLEKIRLQLKLDHSEEYSDNKVISQIVYNTHPGIYRTITTMLKRDFNRGLELNLSEAQNDLRQIYAQQKSSSTSSGRSSKVNDSILAAKGRKITCNNCGKMGHKSDDCWTLEKNKSKRPSHFKKNESINTTTQNNGDNEEKSFCNWCQKPGNVESLLQKTKRKAKNI
jgi:Zinc knuckle